MEVIRHHPFLNSWEPLKITTQTVINVHKRESSFSLHDNSHPAFEHKPHKFHRETNTDKEEINFLDVISNELLLHIIVKNLSFQARYRFALILRQLSLSVFDTLVKRERECHRRARQLIAMDGSLEEASAFLESNSLYMGKLNSKYEHWELWLSATDSEKITLWSQLEECERVEIWYCATKSQRDFLFCNLPIMEKWSTIAHTSKSLLLRHFFLGLDHATICGLNEARSASFVHIEKLLWKNMKNRQQKISFLQIKRQKVLGRSLFIKQLVQLKYSDTALEAALQANDPTWSSLAVAVWKHLNQEGKLQIMSECVRGWNKNFFKEIAEGLHGSDAFQAVLKADSMDWKDLDPLLWPALHNSISRKNLLIGCWVRLEVQDFFKNLFKEEYGELPVFIAVAAEKPDLNPICNAIWPHLNHAGKTQLLICQYGGNFCFSNCLGKQPSKWVYLSKVLEKAIQKSLILQSSTLPSIPHFCSIIWPHIREEDRIKIMMSVFPGKFYQNFLYGHYGEKPLQKVLQNSNALMDEDWIRTVWEDLNAQARQAYLSQAYHDKRKNLFFGQLTGPAVDVFGEVSYDELAGNILIKKVWPYLNEKQKCWWTGNGFDY